MAKQVSNEMKSEASFDKSVSLHSLGAEEVAHVSGTAEAWFSQILAGLVSCICSPGGRESKHNSRGTSPFDPIPPIRQAPLLTERNLPVSVCYKLGGTLGKGGYGHVIAATSKSTQLACALKSVPLAMCERDCQHEVTIAWKMVHPFIAQVYEVFQDTSHVRIVMETCSGGSLAQMVKGISPKKLHEAQVVKYIRQILSGIAYMHHHGFCHRDIKPNNYLLQTKRNDSVLKLIDMGFACPVQEGIPLTQRVGTVECSAPEVVRGSYDQKCDIWSAGIVTFFCVVGYCPFVADTAVACLRKIVREPPQFQMEDWASVSSEMKALITDMLTKDPAGRPTARDLASSYEGWLQTEQAHVRFRSKSADLTIALTPLHSDVTTAASSSETLTVSRGKNFIEHSGSKESLRSISTRSKSSRLRHWVISGGMSRPRSSPELEAMLPEEIERHNSAPEVACSRVLTTKQSWRHRIKQAPRKGAQKISSTICGLTRRASLG